MNYDLIGMGAAGCKHSQKVRTINYSVHAYMRNMLGFAATLNPLKENGENMQMVERLTSKKYLQQGCQPTHMCGDSPKLQMQTIFIILPIIILRCKWKLLFRVKYITFAKHKNACCLP
jgi:hypothetical protein